MASYLAVSMMDVWRSGSALVSINDSTSGPVITGTGDRFAASKPSRKISPTGQTRRRIFAHDSSDADIYKAVPSMGIVDMAPHLGGQIPQTLVLER